MPDNTIKTTLALDGEQQYTRALNEAKTSLRNLGTQLTLAKAEFNKDGDAMKLMQSRSQTLTQEIGKQQAIVKSLQDTVKHCTETYGENTRQTEKWQAELNRAQATLAGLETELNMNNAGLDKTGRQFQSASEKAGLLASSVQGMERTANSVNFMAFNSAIGKVTDGMEKAVRGVAHLASELWNTMRDAATWADDQLTLSQMYGIDVETLQRMQKTAETIDTSVEAIIKGRNKLSTILAKGPSEEQMQWLSAMGLVEVGKYGSQLKRYESAEDFLWDLGEGFKKLSDPIERDAAAMSILGRNFMEYRPMFEAGRQAYDDTMKSWDVVAEENVKNLGTLDDSMKTLEGEFKTLKLTVLSELAPAFNELAGGLTYVLKQVNEYLRSDKGKEKLQALGEAVTRLFENITNIDTGEIIEKVGSALDAVIGALTWISDNWDTVVTAIKAIGRAFIGLKVAEVAGSLAQGVLAFKNLLGGGSTPTTSVPSNMGTAINTATAATAAGGTLESFGGMGLLGKAGTAFALGDLWHDTTGGSMLGWSLLYGLDDRYDPNKQSKNTIALYDTPEGLMTKEEWNERHPGTQIQFRDEAPAVSHSAYKSADQLINAILSGEAQGSRASHSGHGDDYIDPYALPGSSTPNAEMQASWDAIVASVNDTAEGIKTAGNDAADAIETFAGRVNSIVITGPKIHGLAGLLDTWAGVDGMHANGLPWVPYENYLAYLHRGERVVPASQNKSYTANNYLNVQSMYMNNGNDVHALAEAMATETARMQQSFGG